MIDMAQADRTLYTQVSVLKQNAIPWQRALQLAAQNMGYDHWVDVPDDLADMLKEQAQRIRSQG